MSDIDLSGRIRQRREQLGLSQEELAARMKTEHLFLSLKCANVT